MPYSEYECVGFWSVDEFPSPNDQFHCCAPVEASVNIEESFSHEFVAVNNATGIELTVTGIAVEL